MACIVKVGQSFIYESDDKRIDQNESKRHICNGNFGEMCEALIE